MTTTLRFPRRAARAALTAALLSAGLHTCLAPPSARAGFIGDIPAVFGATGIVTGQMARLLVANPLGSDALEVELLFLDALTGTALGASKTAVVEPGQSESLELDAASLGLDAGERAEVIGIAAVSGIGPKDTGVTSLEVFDSLSGETRYAVDPKDNGVVQVDP